MPWWLRNEHTRAWVQPLPRPVGLPRAIEQPRNLSVRHQPAPNSRDQRQRILGYRPAVLCRLRSSSLSAQEMVRRPANAGSSRYSRPSTRTTISLKSRYAGSLLACRRTVAARMRPRRVRGSVPSCMKLLPPSTSPKGTGFLASRAAISLSIRCTDLQHLVPAPARASPGKPDDGRDRQHRIAGRRLAWRGLEGVPAASASFPLPPWRPTSRRPGPSSALTAASMPSGFKTPQHLRANGRPSTRHAGPNEMQPLGAVVDERHPSQRITPCLAAIGHIHFYGPQWPQRRKAGEEQFPTPQQLLWRRRFPCRSHCWQSPAGSSRTPPRRYSRRVDP